MPGKEAVCILPRLEGIGGPASFRSRLVAGLEARQVRIVQEPDHPDCRSILVIGGTRRSVELVRARHRGVRIVQRLNGMNWIHRRRFTGVAHFMRSEINNLLLALTRRYIADRIIYQSNFSRTWWQTVYRGVSASATVIYNGIDLNRFHPEGPHHRPDNRFVVLLVEGHLGGGNEQGLSNAVDLVRLLGKQIDQPVQLLVVGDVPERLRAPLDRDNPGKIVWQGVVKRDEIPIIDRSAHVLFSADLNAACPNAVIEALACGLPVVAYATGSLPELIEGDAGQVVPWGSNYWKLEPPNTMLLAEGAKRILFDQDRFRSAARARAEAVFGLDRMVERYMDIMFG
jgi:glycosyltransferase involved in cell wall biosynthesis